MEPKTGTIVHEHGTYYLEVEGKREELPVGPAMDQKQLQELVGHKVRAFYGEPTLVAITSTGDETRSDILRVVHILCYKPAFDIAQVLGQVVIPEREVGLVLNKMVSAGIISATTAKEIAPNAKIG